MFAGSSQEDSFKCKAMESIHIVLLYHVMYAVLCYVMLCMQCCAKTELQCSVVLCYVVLCYSVVVL